MIGVVWYPCNVEGCNFRAKRARETKRHRAAKHNIDVVWLSCEYDNCSYKAKDRSNLRRHRSSVHNIGITKHFCHPCSFSSKTAGDLRQHKLTLKHRKNTAHLSPEEIDRLTGTNSNISVPVSYANPSTFGPSVYPPPPVKTLLSAPPSSPPRGT